MNYLIEKINHIVTSFGVNKFNYFQFYIIICSCLFVFLIEIIFLGWKNSSIYKFSEYNKSKLNDLISFLIEAFNLFSFISFILCLGIFYKITGYVQINHSFKLLGHIENEYLLFGIVFILGDFKNFIRHLLFHKIPFLWKLHEFHHSATSFNVITRYRGHFYEGAIGIIFDVFPFILIGVPLHTYLIFKVVTEIHQLILHSQISSNWGFIGKYILVSPLAHKIHHSSEEIHYNKNMGVSLIIWDKFFGTYLEDVKEEVKLGVKDTKHNKNGYFYDLLISVKLSFVTFLKIFKIKKTYN
jgi:sterol desaturase/sphingolipid hydroxylase (fatty acid hydroxylase superfamily)